MSIEQPPDDGALPIEFDYLFHVDGGLVHKSDDELPPIPLPSPETGVEVFAGIPSEAEYPDYEHHPYGSEDDFDADIVFWAVVVLRFKSGLFKLSEVRQKPYEIAKDALKTFLRYYRTSTESCGVTVWEERRYFEVRCVHKDGTVSVDSGPITLSFTDMERGVDSGLWETITSRIRNEEQIPLYIELLLDARLYRRRADFRASVLSSAMAQEILVKRAIEAQLTRIHGSSPGASAGKPPRVAKLLNKPMPGPELQLSSVLFPELSDDLLGKCRACQKKRNDIVHEGSYEVTRRDASNAILAVEGLLAVPSIRSALRLAVQRWGRKEG